MTKEKVIDILKGIKDGTACLMPNIAEDGEKAIDIAIKAVEHHEPHWIPVTEEPKESGKYLVTAVISFIPDHVGDPDTYEAVTTANYLADTRYPIRWWGNNVEKVLAWMPLPEAFKGVTE